MSLTAADVKAKAHELGADLCNIVTCATLEASPPDPRWPQVPSRISKRMKTCIARAETEKAYARAEAEMYGAAAEEARAAARAAEVRRRQGADQLRAAGSRAKRRRRRGGAA